MQADEISTKLERGLGGGLGSAVTSGTAGSQSLVGCSKGNTGEGLFNPFTSEQEMGQSVPSAALQM